MAGQKLGQHFLKSDGIVQKIIKTINISSKNMVVEIGPGKGVLTFELTKQAGRVVAIEKDLQLVKLLQKEIKERHIQNCEVLSADIRDFHPTEKLLGTKYYMLVGNIPYYITAYLFQKFLQGEKNQPQKIVFMVQKEVAERIVSYEPKHTLLSVSIWAYGNPKLEDIVSRKFFSPPPRVDSAIISVSDISRKYFIKYSISEENFFTVLHAGFLHPRKVLFNNLQEALPGSKEKLDTVFQNIRIKKLARASELSVEQWFQLSKYLIRPTSQGSSGSATSLVATRL